MRGLLIAAAFLLATAGTSMASTYTVSFSGTVGPAAGTVQGVTLTQGDSFNGTFTFNTNDLTPSPNNTASGFPTAVYTNPGAIQLSMQVGSQTFSYNGSSSSGVTLWRDVVAGNQEFSISSANASPFSLFTLDVVAPNLYGDATDLKSLAFDNLQGNLHFLDNNGGFTSASLHASSVSVAVAATPIPATLPLLLSALGGLGWLAMRQRKTAFAVPAAA